ncbi:MAG: capsular biosynthesis protein, partial [Bacillaceae bacterium]|nr:capsular biosynthesis protein [Bacillaceae bacterium]
ISLASVKGNEYPINPQSNRLIQIGILFGVVVGIGLILLLDSLDNKIKSERQLERIMELPVLGTLSKHNYKLVAKNKGKISNATLRGEAIES